MVRVWRIGTRDGEDHSDHWPAMEQGSYITIGWAKLPDLSDVDDAALRKAYEEAYPTDGPRRRGSALGHCRRFLYEAKYNDVVVASDGSRAKGVGRIKSATGIVLNRSGPTRGMCGGNTLAFGFFQMGGSPDRLL